MEKKMKKIPTFIKNFMKNTTIQEISIGCSNTAVYKITKDNETFFLKIGKIPSLTKEYAALIWLNGKLSVPKCVYFCNDGTNEYLLTTTMAGEMSCSDSNLKKPEQTIKLLAHAIKQLQSVEILECPFRSDLNYKLGLVEYNVKNKLLTDSPSSKIGRELKSYNNIFKYLIDKKPTTEQLVFSHGDTSLPNIFFKDNQVSGFIDVGECGVADKWFDIAICYKSIIRNFPNREDLLKLFLNELQEEYSDKIEYYITLMDLYT